MKYIKTLFILFLLSTSSAFGQDKQADESSIVALQLTKAIEELQIQHDYNVSYFEYKKSLMRHNVATFWFQYFSGIIILIVVIVLVLGGLYISYLQFKVDDSGSTSSIEIGKVGIKVKSNFIGLAILVISFAFFYLYIDSVYTIRDLKPVEAVKVIDPSSESTPNNPLHKDKNAR